MTRVLEGARVADPVLDALAGPVERLADAGHRPGLGTVLTSDDPGAERAVELKGEACADLGVGWVDRRVGPEADTAAVRSAVEELSADPAVHGVFVQLPLPGHVDEGAVRSAVAREKDVDGLHPESLGRLVTGDPRFVPATPRAVLALLDQAGVETAGADVVLVGRSAVVGRPLANLLLRRGEGGDATVTVCHTRTRDLGAVTRRADVVVSGARVPGLLDGSMLAPGAAVVDVGGSRVPTDDGGGFDVVGDVDVASVRGVASVLAPVPGGVGPVTVAMLLRNVVEAASEQAGVPVELP